MTISARQLALQILQSVDRGAFADVALEKTLTQTDLSGVDRRLVTELVYGSIRRQRTLDALVDQFAKKKSHQQPAILRLILHLGLYQLRYLDHIPPSAVVNTTVDLAKANGFTALSGFVNGVLRTYLRSQIAIATDDRQTATPLPLPTDNIVSRLGIQHSYPDWIIEIWLTQFGTTDTEQLCEWFNRSPCLDLRINALKTDRDQVQQAMQAAGVAVHPVPPLPQALRLARHAGAIQQLPGFQEGWWMVQDSSAQLVSLFLDPKPGETVIDACAAPGGKTLHLAELMQDAGIIWACDRTSSRLKKLQENIDRLGLNSIQLCQGDSRTLHQFVGQGDRVLVDAPCSGLGTLHRHADARWRQTPDSVKELVALQTELLEQTSTWVKPDGILVYATCTLNPLENEAIVTAFLKHHPDWQLKPPTDSSPLAQFATKQGWVKVVPHQHNMDGFFMARLQRQQPELKDNFSQSMIFQRLIQ